MLNRILWLIFLESEVCYRTYGTKKHLRTLKKKKNRDNTQRHSDSSLLKGF
jgi:hypothetical protein